MIQVGTKLRVSDNSGGRYASCIKVLNGNKRRYAHIGDKIVVSVNSLRTKRRSQSKVQKGKVMHGIIIRTKSGIKNETGIRTNFMENAVVLINKQGKPLGSRVIGGVPRLIRYTRYMRIATLSAGLIK
jgi:large subunit ribosomal protein L14